MARPYTVHHTDPQCMGDIISGSNPPARDLLTKPSPPAATANAMEVAAYVTTKATWSKKNAQGLSLIQATVSNVIWQKHQSQRKY